MLLSLLFCYVFDQNHILKKMKINFILLESTQKIDSFNFFSLKLSF